MGELRQNQGLSSGSSVSESPSAGSQPPCSCIHHSLVPETNNRVICGPRCMTHQAREESLWGRTWWRGAADMMLIGLTFLYIATALLSYPTLNLHCRLLNLTKKQTNKQKRGGNSAFEGRLMNSRSCVTFSYSPSQSAWICSLWTLGLTSF